SLFVFLALREKIGCSRTPAFPAPLETERATIRVKLGHIFCAARSFEGGFYVRYRCEKISTPGRTLRTGIRTSGHAVRQGGLASRPIQIRKACRAGRCA